LKISKEGYYYQEVSEKKFFVVKDDNENLWYIEPQDAKARIRSFLLKTNSEDNTKKGVAETERFGDDP